MSRYIDADVLLEIIDYYIVNDKDARKANSASFVDGMKDGYFRIRSKVTDMPTADVVEVVRCKDCKWQDKGKNECESWNMCRHNVIEYFAIYDEHFCEWGERREDGE